MATTASRPVGNGREPSVPRDLETVLDADPEAKARWLDLTSLARRDFIAWIDSAKQAATRGRRVASVPSRLASGKRRPCCFAVVPLDLHAAIAAAPAAKAGWRALDASARRDHVDYVNAATAAALRARRIAETCATLASAASRRAPG